MRQPFCILSVLGDVLDDGELHFVGAAQTLGAARRRIEALAESLPGEYIIYDGQTGASLPIIAEAKPESFAFECQIREKHPQHDLV